MKNVRVCVCVSYAIKMCLSHNRIYRGILPRDQQIIVWCALQLRISGKKKTEQVTRSSVCMQGWASGQQYFSVHAYCLGARCGAVGSDIAVQAGRSRFRLLMNSLWLFIGFNLLKPTRHMIHQQSNIRQLYVLPTLYLCVLYLSENKQRLVPLTA
jgi:hypothetical protein